MFIGLTLPVFILGSLALALADYLWRLIKPPVPATVPLSEPYIPPVRGGQCIGEQYLIFAERLTSVWSAPEYVGLTYIAPATITVTEGDTRITFTYPDGTGSSRVASQVEIGATQFRNVFARNVSYGTSSGDYIADACGDAPNPNPPSGVGGSGLPSSPPPILYPPPNSPPNTPPTTPNNNWLQLIAGVAAVAATALTAATAAAAATAATAVTAATAASTAAAAAIASAPSGSTTQQQAQSQKLSADALVGIAQVLVEVSKQIAELEKETRKLKTDEAKKAKDDAKKIIRYDFGSANRDGFIKLYPDSNPDSYEATFIDVQIFNIPSGSGRYFGEKSPHYYKYKSLGQIHFVSPTFGILESREIDFARLSLNVPDNCFGFFYHFGLDGVVSANLSGFYTKTEKQAV